MNLALMNKLLPSFIRRKEEVRVTDDLVASYARKRKGLNRA
jgi:hypothetical protein